MALLVPLLAGLALLPGGRALFRGPLQPEMSNGTFHHYFVPDGDYEDNDDPERCQMLFRVRDERRCALPQDQDWVIRDDFSLVRRQVEESARLLEAVGRSVTLDLDGESSYGRFLRREAAQVGEAFGGSQRALLELEGKLQQNLDPEHRDGPRLGEHVLSMALHTGQVLRETVDVSVGLKDRHELLSLIVRSHGTRLSRLKHEFLKI